MSEIRVVLCTFPDIDSARKIGTHLVEQRLAACVNFVSGVESVYRWQGHVESAQEVLALIKTNAASLPALENEVQSMHPYECPEIVAIQTDIISERYATWLGSCLDPTHFPCA